MARRPTTPHMIDRVLTCAEMEVAIPKIARRLENLNDFKDMIETIKSREDPKIQKCNDKVNDTLSVIFGQSSMQYYQYRVMLDTAVISMGGTPLHEVIEGLNVGIDRAIVTLETIKESFEEQIEDAEIDKSTKTLKAFEGLELHPEIERAAGRLFRDGHYHNAILDAMIALSDFVRLRSGIRDKDGDTLMGYVFSPNNPILKFNNLADQNEISEQRGFMQMFQGAVAALRNPRAHKLISDKPERTLEFIAYISMMANLVDEAKK